MFYRDGSTLYANPEYIQYLSEIHSIPYTVPIEEQICADVYSVYYHKSDLWFYCLH